MSTQALPYPARTARRAWTRDAYDFRVYLIPKLGPKTDADIAMTFVRLEELAPEQRDEVEKAMMIIREKQVPVSNLDALLPGQVVERVREALNSNSRRPTTPAAGSTTRSARPATATIPSAPSRSSAIGTAPSNGTFTRRGGSTTSRASWPTPTSIARFSAATADPHESAHSRQARRPLTGVLHTLDAHSPLCVARSAST